MPTRRLLTTLATAVGAHALAPTALADPPTITPLTPADGSTVITPVGTDR